MGWSHLIGSVVFIALSFYVAIITAFNDPVIAVKVLDQHETPAMPLYISVGSAIVMLGASAYFHLFSCQNEAKCCRLQAYDYAGIALMIAGSSTSPFYYGFMC